MTRIRTIKPTFWTSGSNGRISRDARLLFIGLWNEADDEGRLIGSPKHLAGSLFPHDDDVTPRKVDRWLGELARENKIVRYRVEGVDYLWIVHFLDHQVISRPQDSILPSPEDEGVEFPDHSVNGEGKIEDRSSWERKGREGNGRGRRISPTSEFVPTDQHRSFALEHGLDLERERDRWITWCDAEGRTYVRLNSAFSNWLNNAVEFGRGKKPTASLGDLPW